MPRILIVDDDEIDREAARRCLTHLAGAEIVFAADGEQALQVVSENTPDLVLTDLRMPILDGLALVKGLQEDFPLLPVVLMTSRGSEKIAVTALKAGAASYVPKRDLKEHLLDTVRRVLDVAEASRKKTQAVKYLTGSETRFELANDTSLIGPVVGFLQENLKRIGFGNESERTRIGIALTEAICNAIIHGNLEVDSDLRRVNLEAFEALIKERQEQEPYSSRRVYCQATESAREVSYLVRDQGPGFDPESLPDTPRDLLDIAGRGLFLIRTFMDVVEFNSKGNQLTMSRRVRVGPP